MNLLDAYLEQNKSMLVKNTFIKGSADIWKYGKGTNFQNRMKILDRNILDGYKRISL